ncbi:MAG: SDR family NAD(P)-dependent oxidoreductase [Cyclobacteriaceae bacterium]|nr:SDR family NAD(P)-dependent oxidoreductase [Cyclobacteriaceae bacterium]
MDQKQGKYQNPAMAILTGIKDLFSQKTKAGMVREEDRLDNKNILVTGANSGLGYATALHLAKRGANIYMACRSGIPEKGEEIKKISVSRTIWMLQVDLSDLDSIESLVKKITARKLEFDTIICNAAMVPRQSRETKQGLEEMFTVNYLAKYMLIRRLLDNNCIRTGQSQRSRIIFISSESHRNPEAFDWQNFGLYQPYGMGKTVELYGYYKLLLTTFARELSRRQRLSGVSVFALCPGPVNTRIAREAPWVIQPILKLIFAIFFRSPMKAAETVVYFATSPDFENISFDYLHLMTRKEIDPMAADPENGRKLWELSEKLLEGFHIRLGQNQKSDMD